MNVPVLSPARASARCWSNGRRTSAWMPVRKMRPDSRTYLSLRVTEWSGSGSGVATADTARPSPREWSTHLTIGQAGERPSALALPDLLELGQVLVHHRRD